MLFLQIICWVILIIGIVLILYAIGEDEGLPLFIGVVFMLLALLGLGILEDSEKPNADQGQITSQPFINQRIWIEKESGTFDTITVSIPHNARLLLDTYGHAPCLFYDTPGNPQHQRVKLFVIDFGILSESTQTKQ